LPSTLQRLIARSRSLAQRLKPQSASSRNVLKLAGGTAGSQVISVAAAPILTRLYGPESFGVLATFASILALLNVVSSLRYELAIAVPEEDDEAVALVWLCFVLVAISTGLTALGVLLLGDQLVIWLNEPALKPSLWLLPVGVLLSGVYQPLSYWAIRRKQFGLLAQTKFRQSFFALAINLTFASFGAIGLILGQIASISFGSFQILGSNSSAPVKPSSVKLSYCIIKDSFINALTLLSKYSNISTYNSAAGVANSLFPFLYAFILSASGSLESLGLLFLAKRLVDAPSAFISKSVGDIFLSQIARAKETSLAKVCFKNLKILSIASTSVLIPYVLALILFGDKIFGSIWDTRIQIYLACLVPSSILQIAVGSTGLAFVTSNRNLHGFLAQIGMLIFRLIPLVSLLLLGGPVFLLPLFICLGLFLGYFFYGYILVKSLLKVKVST
jgi:O-antigen/teichoic acid export membrane protein